MRTIIVKLTDGLAARSIIRASHLDMNIVEYIRWLIEKDEAAKKCGQAKDMEREIEERR